MYEHEYQTRRGYLHARQTAHAHLGVSEDRDVPADVVFSGRDVRTIARFGRWSIRHFCAERPAFGEPSSAAQPAFYDAISETGGISLGFTYDQGGLPALIEHLREHEARDLPPCSCS
jgi:hypothetical protein